MIIPMKKIFLVVQDKDVVPSLDALKNFGAVHVEHIQKPSGARVQELREGIHRFERVIAALSSFPAPAEQVDAGDAEKKAAEVLELLSLIEQLKEASASRQNVLQQWEPWGDFNPSDIEFLQGRGIFIQFVELTEKELARPHEGVVLHPVFVKKGIAHCLAISREKVKLPYLVFTMPPAGVAELRRQQELDRGRIAGAEQGLAEAAKHLSSFHKVLTGLREDLMFEETYAGRGREERLAVVNGFCPAETCAALERLAKKESWGCLIEDPSGDDHVPTLVRNPGWVNLIRPVFDLINIFPGYREVDISVIFLIFFSVFVGMLIGDAGYGLIVFLATVFLQAWAGRKSREKTLFFLLYTFAFCIMGWGILTGTFFGQQWIPRGTIRPLLPWLNDTIHVQFLCFLIGAVHLSIAHIWRVIRFFPSLVFLADAGWLILVWVMLLTARTLILGAPFPPSGYGMLIAGVALVVLFTCPNKNPLKAIGPGIGDLLLKIVNTFTDVVSYIRLFAVGLAGVAVADAANAMAQAVGFGNFFAGAGAVAILILGHGFNLVLGALAILVHALRLNVLEFSGHVGLEWNGFPYQPFRRIQQVKSGHR